MFRGLAAWAAVGAVALAGCGAPQPAADDGGAAGGRVAVAAAFYPLVYATEQVGGDRVRVTSLTKPGAEPHDLELTPREVADLADADLVVYESGFQPAVDTGVADLSPAAVLDVAPAARLDLTADPSGTEHTTSEHDHAGGTVDPHFWLDPTRYADAGLAIGRALARVDPDHAAAYRAGARRFAARMAALDREFRDGLVDCRVRDLVTGHEAFGYLAARYGFTEHGVTGLDPDAEPSAAALADVIRLVREKGITTVYTETLAAPGVTETVARETGAELAVLDPVEGITDSSPGRSYPEVMRADLAALRAGQGCS